MEQMLFVDGVYPDFSLLKQVLLPPYLEADPSTGSHIVREWAKNDQSFAKPQYCGDPLGVTVGKGTSRSTKCTSRDPPGEGARPAEQSVLQYRGVVGRGSTKLTKNRSTGGKAQACCQPGRHTRNSRNTRDKMAYLMQPPEQNIIYFMQESAKLIPKVENKEWGPSPCCTRDGHTEYREHNYSPCLRNCSRMGQSSSSISTETLSQNYNAMELLNLISNKCTRLNNLDVGHSSGMRDDLELKLCEVENDFRGVREVKEGRPPTSDEVNIACSKRGQERKGGTILECENPITNCNKKKVVTRQTGREELSNCTSGEVLTNGGNDVQKEGKDKALEGGSLAKKEALDQGIYSRKTPRKQRTPAKSVQKFDPSFQGIEFQLHLGFEKENFGDCHLIVTSFYRGKSRRGSVKSKRRLNSASLSSGSEDDQNSQLAKKTKQCASCKTQKTPLWRDAEDGTPLCNACGIRYKKYKVRCYNCWNIPKKDGKSYSKYCDCGGAFRSHI